jgi:hypothetical protein
MVMLRERPGTADELRAALRLRPSGGALWLRGAGAPGPALLQALRPYVELGESCAVVSDPTGRPGAVRYTVDPDGRLRRLAPGLRDGVGELLGVNYLAPADRARFAAALAACAATDRAEHALAIAIAGGMVVHPVEPGSALLPRQRRRITSAGVVGD